MKNEKRIYTRLSLLLGFIIATAVGCERDYDFGDDAEFAKFGNNPEVFIDGFSGGLEYLPFGGSKLDAFSVDTEVKYNGNASMRFDVPNFGDSEASLGFAGAIFPDYGGRDLSGYDALTFWAKATRAETISQIGFGSDFGESPYRDIQDKYLVTKANLRLSTGWTKYIIPIPDPSKLINETGMFWYAEGPDANGDGYTFWIDELQFEKLGTVAQAQPAIFAGVDLEAEAFLDIQGKIPDEGLTQTFNLANGVNETVFAAPSYFTFNSTNPEVVQVSELGVLTPVGLGTTTISATLGGVRAQGSATLEVKGGFEFAPVPTRSPDDVISVFSDAYTNVPGVNTNPNFGGQTTTGGTVRINDENEIISYDNLNFVATIIEPTINVSQKTHLHVDIRIEETIDSGDTLRFELFDFGSDGAFGGGNDTGGAITYSSGQLESGTWISLDIPFTAFTENTGGGASGFVNSAKTNLAQVVFASGGVSALFVDNIYFYSE
ncbi:MAG: Ig-like domain-containing protein [Eudoraea sp.]|nr:Ig-like domain-containing protein [Eudoraea sp.]NNK29943.1 glycosyl hydrolase family 16 [Flavobacteriaceae bacterium]